MQFRTMATAALATSALTAMGPAWAQDSFRIVDEPLDLTIHMHWDRAQGYREDYPVELKARELTGINLIDTTSGKNTTDTAEAMNLLLAEGDMPDIVGSQLIKQPVNEFGPQGAFVPLNDLIDEYAPNITAFFDARPELRQAI
ncbi:putative aldouronate transport system substrate-binding protein [Loktanella salsilacus]|uniref:Putative aldouronate transport system substrate-binding protein n=2 Tax=Loktanella salsilacus TaxID=195913 RepID=A0A1I4FG15_9RHOB|nr:hypothetical protein [Loktanella salsilacus]SFL15746.1 putative aldouronate transport system substrate-binding protein [Loktanella salsilacus]